MRHRSIGVIAACAVLIVLTVVARPSMRAAAVQAPAATGNPGYVVNDTHFHLTNYIQEGIDARAHLKNMGTKVGRSTLFGIPLQQTWAYGNTGDFAPWYYTQTDAPL